MSNGIMYGSTFLLGTVLCIIVQTSTAAITSTDCTPNDDTDGDIKCQEVDPNAECPTDTTKCACKTGYKVDPADDTKCLLSITDVDCSPDDENNGDAKCRDLDANSECPTGASKCACKTGYTGTDVCMKINENSECPTGASKCACKTGYTGTDVCMKMAITDVDCSPEDENNGDAKCQDLDENSECPTGASKCACKTGYTGNDVCMKMAITDVDCSPEDVENGDAKCQDLDENSECPTGDTKCACKTGYTGTDTCSKESSADSVKVTMAVIAMSSLSLIVRRIM